MITKNILSFLKALLLWVPFIVFFAILLTMIASNFKNPTDEYFVSTVLRACLVLIISTFVAQFFCISILMLMSYTKLFGYISYIESFAKSVSTLPIVDMGIYCIALFVAYPEFELWHEIIAVLLIVPTMHYWTHFLKGPLRNLHQFAVFHQVSQSRVANVLSSFYIAAYVDYFFIVLKRTLLPLVFVLSVMDFRIMLPRLVEAGMSISAFVMFFSLLLSLHLLTLGKDRQT